MYKAAEANGNVPVVTEWADNHKLAPKVIVSSILVQVAKSATDGTWQGKHYQFSLPSDWGPVMANTDLLPDKIKYIKNLSMFRNKSRTEKSR